MAEGNKTIIVLDIWVLLSRSILYGLPLPDAINDSQTSETG